MRGWYETLRAALTRFRIERPNFIRFPKFRTTLFFLWVIASIGFFSNHMREEARSTSLLFTGFAWLGALFIVLLHNPRSRLRLLLWQLFTITITVLSLLSLVVTLFLIFGVPTSPLSLELAWALVSFALVLVVYRVARRTLEVARAQTEPYYPGKTSAPLLFIIFLLNYVWWYWELFLTFFG